MGESPATEEYLRDYPEYAGRLRLQVELHRALEATDPGGSGPTEVLATSGDRGATPGGARPGRAARPGPPGYEVLEELGRGGMGVVYKARHLRLNRVVALKMILAGDLAGPEALVRFLHEAEVVARLRHPNIVQIHGVGEHEGRPYVELEYVEGGGLDRRLDGTPRPAREAARLVEQLARAIDHAHRLGVVHRDLKPANVLLCPDGTPKVADFGLAKCLAADPGLTGTGAILGTPRYMAPEQAAGETKAVGPAADVYSLGVVLYELLTGRCPFRGTTPLETLEQVRTLDPVPPRSLRPGLPRDLETVCLKCLEKDPARRYADAGALAEDLRRHLGGEPILARDSSVFERLASALRRGEHDREFRRWGGIVLAFTPFAALPHLALFAASLAAPGSLQASVQVPMAVFLALVAVAAWLNRSRLARLRLPSTPAVRHFVALLLGLFASTALVLPAARLAGISTGPGDDVILYPFFSLLNGQFFFSLGGSYWGRCYLIGLACLLASLPMAASPTLAPLVFALTVLISFSAVGLHLRRLGRERSDAPPESPDRSP
jgi:serine/threonine-protein kinase